MTPEAQRASDTAAPAQTEALERGGGKGIHAIKTSGASTCPPFLPSFVSSSPAHHDIKIQAPVAKRGIRKFIHTVKNKCCIYPVLFFSLPSPHVHQSFIIYVKKKLELLWLKSTRPGGLLDSLYTRLKTTVASVPCPSFLPSSPAHQSSMTSKIQINVA